jgi:hypothetical protein
MRSVLVALRQFVAIVGMASVLIFTSDLAHLLASPPTHHRQTLVGDAARAHMEQKWAANPQRKAEHERAVAFLMNTYGYHPIEKYSARIDSVDSTAVDRMTRRIVDTLAPSVFAEEFHGSTSAGEIDEWTWSTGDPSTYAGEIFLEHYDTGNDDDAVIDAGWVVDVSSAGNYRPLDANNAYNSLVNYTACALSGCSGGLTYCWLTGAGFAPCAGIYCIASEVGCGIYAAFSHIYHRAP